ncbi:DUF2061 domain-containing protein [Leisingera sp. M527]|uniref:DUF2061 domain-containing protein n=1 Tax=unclassified Leisingera TaxID=2614906 RepID=UPI0021A61E55|nr:MULTISPECIES: DUF2061 domain-containing protein [unclassified Leisingera]UWQ31732.1 DUF2061 domain-containing protein [Leisingera sp. M527]UWQ73720.1 DUF2061 domain-containing protein [Leisingera sp. M658]
METHRRSIVKAVIWNILGLVMMTLVGLIVTGSVKAGGMMALVNTAIGFTVYLIYERAWSKIQWGRSHV